MMLVDLLFNLAETFLREHPDDTVIPTVAFQAPGIEQPMLAVLDGDTFEHRHDTLRTLIAKVHPTACCLMYDGYATLYTDDPCSHCLGEEKGGCDHCRGSGHEPDAHGRRDAIIVVELTTTTPIVHSRPYERLAQWPEDTPTILFDARWSTNDYAGEDTTITYQSEYPSL